MCFSLPAKTTTTAIQYRNTTPGVGYVGSKVCRTCHADIYNEYIRTAMGRSATLPSYPTQLALASSPVKVDSDGHEFEVFRRGSDVFESVYELDSKGRPTYRHTEQLVYAIGAGMFGYTYLIRRGDRLFEAPLSYFSKLRTWGVSPGYEFRNELFDRPALLQCVVCHTGRARPVPKHDGAYQDPPIESKQLAIGCENCHGPGALHVEERLRAAPVSSPFDSSIVNPAHLQPWLANNVCMQCHELGDARVVQTGKTLLDFRPGTPLADVVTIFKASATPASLTESPHLAYYWTLSMSRCFIQSQGKMACITCHDPHKELSGDQAVAYFRSRCLACHTNQSCRLPIKVRMAQNPANNCFGCHMPKAKSPPGTHAQQTDHRIVTYEGEPPPPGVFGQSTPGLPDLVELDAIPGSTGAVPTLTRLQAYEEMAESDPARYEATYLAILQKAGAEYPGNPTVLLALADQSYAQGDAAGQAQAIRYLRRAINLGANDPKNYMKLASALAASNHISEAVAILQTAISLDPYYKQYFPLLALCYFALHQDSKAHDTIRRWLTLFPEDHADAANVVKEAARSFGSR